MLPYQRTHYFMAKKKVEILVDDKYSPELVQSLKDNAHVKVVYLNEAGAWHFNPAAGFEPVNVEDIFSATEDKKSEE